VQKAGNSSSFRTQVHEHSQALHLAWLAQVIIMAHKTLFVKLWLNKTLHGTLAYGPLKNSLHFLWRREGHGFEKMNERDASGVNETREGPGCQLRGRNKRGTSFAFAVCFGESLLSAPSVAMISASPKMNGNVDLSYLACHRGAKAIIRGAKAPFEKPKSLILKKTSQQHHHIK
jgi:hypothetical protein